MKIIDEKDYENCKELLDAYYEEIDALEDMIKHQKEQCKKIKEAVDDYEYENGRGDQESQEDREMELQNKP